MNDERAETEDCTVADGGTGSVDVSESAVSEPEREDGERAEPMSEAQREFLLEAVRRAPLLQLLRSEPAAPGTILESIDMSRSTFHRSINALEEYDVVEKTDGEYELTGAGEILVEELKWFSDRACTALSLTEFLNSIEINGDRIPIEHFVNAEMTRREPRQPHATIHRIIRLIERSDDLRMFSTVISPVYVDVGYREMMDGMHIEAVFDREVIDLMLSEYPEKAYETITTGNFDVYAHNGLPFELFLFDDRIGMAAHNENGNAEVFVECKDPSAIEWAEDLYTKHLSKADPIALTDR